MDALNFLYLLVGFTMCMAGVLLGFWLARTKNPFETKDD